MTHLQHLFIFAGELSGDMHGGKLLEAFRLNGLHFESLTGVGGPDMRAQGVDNVFSMEDFDVMGFSDVLRCLPRLWKQFYRIRDHILNTAPQAAVFIDSPSFSLRMASSLRRCGFKGKIVQYISPTVWAWGRNRILKMANTLDLLLTIYPFEAQHFTQTSLKVEYVGNPVHERVRHYQYDPDWHKACGIPQPERQQLLALFPGSREGEIQRNLPKQLKAAQQLHEDYPETSLAISCANDHHKSLILHILNETGWSFKQEIFFVPKKYSYELMRSCRSAIAKSGTVTLELALHGCPTVVVYELTLLNHLIAKYILRVNLPHYCIVNILRGRTVFPELIADGFTPENLIRHIKELHIEGIARKQCVEECLAVQGILKEENASQRAVQAIIQLFK